MQRATDRLRGDKNWAELSTVKGRQHLGGGAARIPGLQVLPLV